MDNNTIDDASESSGSWSSHRAVLFSVWLLALVVFIFLPCLVNRRVRRRFLRRLRERRWNVEEDETEEPTWYTAARNRYEAARAREMSINGTTVGEACRSKEEEKTVQQEYLLTQMSKYSITLQEEDFKRKMEPCESNDSDNGDDEDELDQAELIEEGQSETLGQDHLETLPEHAFDTSNTVVSILPAGVCVEIALPRRRKVKKREVPAGCAICLCEFTQGEEITWAANKNCIHVFHNTCILNWLLSVGRKSIRRRNIASRKQALDFPMLCPCCRQPFVTPSSKKPKAKVPLEDREVAEEIAQETL